jgi:hypothetical protein
VRSVEEVTGEGVSMPSVVPGYCYDRTQHVVEAVDSVEVEEAMGAEDNVCVANEGDEDDEDDEDDGDDGNEDCDYEDCDHVEYEYELGVVVVKDNCPKCVLQPNHIAYSGIWLHNSSCRPEHCTVACSR